MSDAFGISQQERKSPLLLAEPINSTRCIFNAVLASFLLAEQTGYLLAIQTMESCQLYNVHVIKNKRI